MADNDDMLSGERPSNNAQMSGIRRVQGTAAPQPGQGARTADSGTGTASATNSQYRLDPLFRPAKEEPNQGPRNYRTGAGGTASLAGRGTMEKK